MIFREIELAKFVYFSDFYQIDPDIIDSYGALNISLLSDLPLFIEPLPPKEYVNSYLLLMIGNTTEEEEGYCGKGNTTSLPGHLVDVRT